LAELAVTWSPDVFIGCLFLFCLLLCAFPFWT
jgi:hypothetical protein